MANAFIALQQASDAARLQRAQDIVTTGDIVSKVIWDNTTREHHVNEQMLHSLAQMKRIKAAARAAAELVAGDLLEEERVRSDENRRQIRLSAVEKRKVRRAATHQRNKILRREQETERQQQLDEARRIYGPNNFQGFRPNTPGGVEN